MNIQKLEIEDKTGVLKNINDLLDEYRNGNLAAFALVFKRKDDGSCRSFITTFDRHLLAGILEQLKMDVLEVGMEAEVIDCDQGLDEE